MLLISSTGALYIATVTEDHLYHSIMELNLKATNKQPGRLVGAFDPRPKTFLFSPIDVPAHVPNIV